VTATFPPYGATAVRPAWADLPFLLRAAVQDRLGAPVTAAASAGGGFTDGFASVLTTSAGDRVFVKAASAGTALADWYAREAAITAALPAGVPAPRPRWTLMAAGHVVLCLDAVDGHVPRLPWRPAELDAAQRAWGVSAGLLRHPPDELRGLPSLADLAREDLSWWTEMAAGREPLPPVPGFAAGRVRELAALERLLWAYPGTGVIHGDLRLDNIVIDGAGAAWICDWTWPCRGPAWFDTATLLVTAHASGLDADALFAAHPTAADAPADALDAALAALSGHWLVRAADPPRSAHRTHQSFSGRQALAWLATRRGWCRGVLEGIPDAW
jgi:Phosphotransferase enzyme family